MNRVFDFIRRHLRLFAGLAVVLLAAVVTLAVRASGPAHAAASAPHALSSSSATGSASTAPNPASHNTFTALAGRSHRPSTAGARPATPTRRGRVAATLTRPSGRRGLRTPAPTPAALSLALRQATGLSPAQVTSRSVCAPAQAGQARCAAEALVLRSNGGLVRPHVHPGATLGRVRPTGRSTVKPATTSSSAPPQADTPAYLEQAYDLSYLSQNEGNGDTVAIVDAYNDPTAQADLNTYRSTYGLPACGAGCFTQVNESGNASPLPATSGSWQVEISLDLDTVSAICPNCHILLVEAKTSSTSDLWRAMQTAANLGADQISDSWTSTSSSAFPASFVPSNVPVVAATGDDGYLGAGEDNYPAALPGVTAAGGTSLASATGNARGFSEGAWSGAGSGCDLNVAKPTWQTDTGCTGRSYADLSADAAPATGLEIYVGGAWQLVGGTSLATPLISSYYALTGVTSGSAQWAYANSGLLNDVTSGSNGSCAIGISYICNAGPGYDGPTGVGSISGDVVAGAPGIGGPSIAAGSGNGSGNSYTEAIRSDGATLTGGIYPNGLDTTWWIDYWPASGGSVQQTPATEHHVRLRTGRRERRRHHRRLHLQLHDLGRIADHPGRLLHVHAHSVRLRVDQLRRQRVDRLRRDDHRLQLGLRRRQQHRRRRRHADRCPSVRQPRHLQRHRDPHQQRRPERDDDPERHRVHFRAGTAHPGAAGQLQREQLKPFVRCERHLQLELRWSRRPQQHDRRRDRRDPHRDLRAWRLPGHADRHRRRWPDGNRHADGARRRPAERHDDDLLSVRDGHPARH